MMSHPTMATAILVQQSANFDQKNLYHGEGSKLNVLLELENTLVGIFFDTVISIVFEHELPKVPCLTNPVFGINREDDS
jgi:hypothetical protein